MELDDRINVCCDGLKSDYLADLFALLRIPGMSEFPDEPSEEAPFGKTCSRALEEMLALCRKYGLRTRKVGAAMGIAEYGDGPREMDILTHLDVQPAGDGWSSDPFEPEIRDGCVFCRGASDDKGPAMATLYAVRALRALNVPLRRTVRLVFGTGEEYGIADIGAYLAAEPLPPFAFTPDDEYPVTNLSRSAYTADLDITFSSSDALPCILSVIGGDNRGAVPGTCKAVLSGLPIDSVAAAAKARERRLGVTFSCAEQTDGIVRIDAQGRSNHAAFADRGISAVTAMLDLLLSLPLADCQGLEKLRAFNAVFPHNDFYGEKGGIFLSDALSGKSLYNVGVFRYAPDALSAKLRAGLPLCASDENIHQRIVTRMAQGGICWPEAHVRPGRHIPLTEPHIVKLLSAYEHFSGLPSYGMASSGGSYADSFPNGVAFGCVPPGLDTRMHGPDEFVRICDMMMSMKIFARAIADICG